MRGWVLLVSLLSGATALAQDAPPDDPPIVALLPLDGAPGTSSRDMSVVMRGLADAMAQDGRVIVVSGEALVDRLTSGKAAELQEARDAFAEGRLLLSEGDPDIGLAFLAEAVAGHGRAGSVVVRREEMADAAFILAKALLAVGDDAGARTALTDALRLLPDYLDTQSEAADPALRSLALQVEADLVRKPPRRLSTTGALALTQDLQVDRIIHGFVVDGGRLSLSVFDGESVVHSITRPGPLVARRIGDPWYTTAAAPLTHAALGLDPQPDPPPPVPVVEPTPVIPVPPPPRRGKAGNVALGLIAGVVAVGAATGGTLYAMQRSRGPTDAWELEIMLVR